MTEHATSSTSRRREAKLDACELRILDLREELRLAIELQQQLCPHTEKRVHPQSGYRFGGVVYSTFTICKRCSKREWTHEKVSKVDVRGVHVG